MEPTQPGEPAVNEADFTFRPHNSVTAILPADRLDACLSALRAAGVDLTTTETLSGPEGAEILDSDGSNHGLRARLVRGVQMLGSSQNELINYSTALQDGDSVLLVPVADEESADSVAQVLGDSGGTRMLYFRSTAVERL